MSCLRRLTATEIRRAASSTSWSLTCNAFNTPPVITSSPVTVGITGLQYQYQVWAQDAEKEALSYSVVTGPSDGLLQEFMKAAR